MRTLNNCLSLALRMLSYNSKNNDLVFKVHIELSTYVGTVYGKKCSSMYLSNRNPLKSWEINLKTVPKILIVMPFSLDNFSLKIWQIWLQLSCAKAVRQQQTAKAKQTSRRKKTKQRLLCKKAFISWTKALWPFYILQNHGRYSLLRASNFESAIWNSEQKISNITKNAWSWN